MLNPFQIPPQLRDVITPQDLEAINKPLVLRKNINALKPTGPRTSEGKAASSKNAIKHGLTARQVVIPGESQSDFDALLAGIAADLSPNGELETELVGEIAACAWRLARARAKESQILDYGSQLFDSAHAHLGWDRLMRYMSAIERQFNRATVRLQQLQSERRKTEPAQAEPAKPDAEEPLRVMAAGACGAASEFVSQNAAAPYPVTRLGAAPAPMVSGAGPKM